ncbi:hypothetical protein [Anaerotruncus rubiinfantis]|uniref:hypothetical protein n=1 Tax=Anaerotruncus rubiinfantis TaxID=1720200 RepID=UPI0034A45CC0
MDKKKANARRTKLWKRVLFLLPLLLLLPLAGNLASSVALGRYADEIYPGATRQSGWLANYNPVSGRYGAVFAVSGESVNLEFDLIDGTIQDPKRSEAYEAQTGLSDKLRMLNARNAGNWIGLYHCAHLSDFGTLKSTLHVDLLESADTPLPSQAEMREKLADRALAAWSELHPLCEIERVRAGYSHETVNRKKNKNEWNILIISLPGGRELNREDFQTGKIKIR